MSVVVLHVYLVCRQLVHTSIILIHTPGTRLPAPDISRAHFASFKDQCSVLNDKTNRARAYHVRNAHNVWLGVTWHDLVWRTHIEMYSDLNYVHIKCHKG